MRDHEWVETFQTDDPDKRPVRACKLCGVASCWYFPGFSGKRMTWPIEADCALAEEAARRWSAPSTDHEWIVHAPSEWNVEGSKKVVVTWRCARCGATGTTSGEPPPSVFYPIVVETEAGSFLGPPRIGSCDVAMVEFVMGE